MTDTLIIRLQQTQMEHDSLVEWLLFDPQQQKIDGTNTVLSELSAVLAPLSDDYRVYVIVAVEDVLLTPVTIPSKQAKQIKQALPFMVEELIAQEIETVHLAIPSPLDTTQGVVDVAVVQHTVLIHWLDLLHSNNLSPTSIAVDTLCVPRDNASWTLAVDSNRMLIRTGDNAGLSCELNDCEMILKALIQTLDNDTSVQVKPTINLVETRGAEVNSELIPTLLAYLHQHFPAMDVKHTQYKEDSSELFARQYLQTFDNTLNLLQGGYRVGTGSENNWQRWRLVASVAALVVVSYVLLSVASGWYFNYQAEQLDAEMVALYKRIFPNERRVVSAKKQMQNHLRQRSGAGGAGQFLPLLAQAATPLVSQPDNNFTVQQLRFNADRNDLQLEVRSQSIEQLDQFKQVLASSGLNVDILSATEQDNTVLGRLVVGNIK